MIDKTFDVRGVPLLDFTLTELARRYQPLRYTPDTIIMTPEQHEQLSPVVDGIKWTHWRGLKIKIKEAEK